MSPKVVIGVPLYNNATYLSEALESLLSQTYRDYALILVDDRSSDDTPAVVARYLALDDRISYMRNDQRLGMILNWRKTFETARERHPEMLYFAWATDHDVWHPRWLRSLVHVLDAERDVVMAYPLNFGIDHEGRVMRHPWEFDTYGVEGVRERVSMTSRGMAAGNMVYSLFRAEVLARCGVYRLLLLPDRLLMTELALHGQFKQVREVLWYRRYRPEVKPSVGRQRAAFFPNGAPLYAYLPWSALHSAAMAWSLLVRGSGRPEIGRSEAVSFSAWYSTVAVRHQLFRWFRHRVKDPRRLLLKRALPALTRRLGGNRTMTILSKHSTRASEVVRARDLSWTARARELADVGWESAAQLAKARAQRSAEAGKLARAKPSNQRKGAVRVADRAFRPRKASKVPKPPKEPKAAKQPKAVRSPEPHEGVASCVRETSRRGSVGEDQPASDVSGTGCPMTTGALRPSRAAITCTV